MNKVLVSTIIFLLCLSQSYDMYSQKSTQTNIMTPELLYSLYRIGDFQISPDGQWVLYIESLPDIEKNKTLKTLKAITIDGKSSQTILSSEWGASNCVWFPDGQFIAFLSSKSGSSQIYKVTFPTGEPEQITKIENGISTFKLSPDGAHFLFSSDVKLDKDVVDLYPNLPKANARIYRNLPVRHWDKWLDNNYSHLFMVPVHGGESKDLSGYVKYHTPDPPFGGSEQYDWAPDNFEIAYTCKKDDHYQTSTNTDIFLINVRTGEERVITKGMNGYDKNPLYSPDGKWIAFLSMDRAGFESDRTRLMLFNRETKEISELTKSLDQWVEQFIWAPDSKVIYFNAADGGTVQIYMVTVPDGKVKMLTKGVHNFDAGLDISKDGSTIVAGKRTMLRPTELYTLNTKNFNDKQLTKANDEIYKNLSLPKVEEKWVTTKDNKKLHTWVIYPPNFDKNKKYPMITYCQGGPQSTISQYFSYRWNFCLMASQGYVVVAPNRRGAPGFGQAWVDAISKDWGGKPMQDILDATDFVLKEPYIKKDGVAAVGASAGGYAVFWLEGNHNKRFSAFVAHSGVFNFESKYGSTEELWFPNWEYGGPYWDEKNKEFYEKNSPHKFADKWDTPIMISTGEMDFRVPYTQSLEAFTLAQQKGITSKLVIFPEENHWILKPQNALVWNYEFWSWLDFFCKK